MHFYSDEEINYLREIAPEKSNKEMAELFNKKFNTDINYKALASTRKRYGITTGRTGYFPKGNIPPNKGTKGLTGANKTSFKKGHTPKNHKHVGSERIDSKDGYLLVKVAEPNKWQLKHRVIYEEHNDKIPKGYNVIFGDGDNRNFDINSLILVSRKQLLRLNKNNLIQKDADLTRTAVIITDLQDKIYQRSRG